MDKHDKWINNAFTVVATALVILALVTNLAGQAIVLALVLLFVHLLALSLTLCAIYFLVVLFDRKVKSTKVKLGACILLLIGTAAWMFVDGDILMGFATVGVTVALAAICQLISTIPPDEDL